MLSQHLGHEGPGIFLEAGYTPDFAASVPKDPQHGVDPHSLGGRKQSVLNEGCNGSAARRTFVLDRTGMYLFCHRVASLWMRTQRFCSSHKKYGLFDIQYGLLWNLTSLSSKGLSI
jgi:hypothetical protein